MKTLLAPAKRARSFLLGATVGSLALFMITGMTPMKTLLIVLVLLVHQMALGQAGTPTPQKKDPFANFGGTALDKKPGTATPAVPAGSTALDRSAQQVTMGPAINGIQLVKATYSVGTQKHSVAGKVQKLLQAGNVSTTHPVQIFASGELLYYKQSDTTRTVGVVQFNRNGGATVQAVTQGPSILTITYRMDGAEKTLSVPQGGSITIPQP